VSHRVVLLEANVELPIEISQAVAKEVAASSEKALQLPLIYDSPQEIYRRYTILRSASYAAQPAGAIKTN
jgi:hypothetical protein